MGPGHWTGIAGHSSKRRWGFPQAFSRMMSVGLPGSPILVLHSPQTPWFLEVTSPLSWKETDYGRKTWALELVELGLILWLCHLLTRDINLTFLLSSSYPTGIVTRSISCLKCLILFLEQCQINANHYHHYDLSRHRGRGAGQPAALIVMKI